MEIQEIESIHKLVKSAGVSPFKNLFKGELKNTKKHELLCGIEAGQFNSEEIASKTLYNANPSNNHYIKLKANFGKTAVHDLIFYDFSQRFSPLVSRSFRLQRILIGIRILLAGGLRNIATHFAKNLYESATEYDHTEIRLSCLRILRESFILKGETSFANYYNIELKKVLWIFNEEIRAEEECQLIESPYIRSAAQNREIADRAFKYEDYLQDIRKYGTSSTIELYRYRILIYALQISNSFSDALAVSLEALEYLEKNPLFSSKSRQAEFTLASLDCAIMLRDYDSAIKYGQRTLELFTVGKKNWYVTLNRVLIAALHKGVYNLSIDLYKKSLQYKSSINLPIFEQEKWQLCKAFIFLFFETGNIIPIDKKLTKELIISDFIISLPELAKDKGGLNIPIHVLQILYYIYKKQHIQASTRINLFKLYVQRYLDEEEYPRTYLFLAMLKNLRKVHYDTLRAEKLCENYYKELICASENFKQSLELNEIIPYDVLWLWILKNCKLGKYEVQ